jgi:hypothetical protein
MFFLQLEISPSFYTFLLISTMENNEERPRKRERRDDPRRDEDSTRRPQGRSSNQTTKSEDHQKHSSFSSSSSSSSSSSLLDRLLSARSLERYDAAVQSHNDAVKKNPLFRGVQVAYGLGPYYFMLRRWLLETKRVRHERQIADDSSARLFEDLCDFAVEFNTLKLGIEYYSTEETAVKGSEVAERVRQATHGGDWMDVSVPQERRR